MNKKAEEVWNALVTHCHEYAIDRAIRLRKEIAATEKSNPSRCAVQTGSGRGVVTRKDNNYLQQ
jgi:hypothetical protein